jgi:predicted N-acetyltransferase YhbS
MKITRRKYNPAVDFGRVRDFLVDSFSLTEKPLNWKLERWNYTRYFITPMLVTEGIGEPDLDAVADAIQLWNESTALWENEAGAVVGVVNIEHADKNHPGWGEFFCQHHPDYEALLPDLLHFAEEHLRNREKDQVFVPVYDYDEALIATLTAHNYYKNTEYTLWEALYLVSKGVPSPNLPKGYRLRSMADMGSDIDKRRKAFGVGFNHPDPRDWPSRLSYEGLQQAPDYRSDLDIYVVAPDGEYASFCIAWWDATNKIASLEPVGTAPEHRRKGLARAAVMEAISRVADLGAERVFVGSDQEFYLASGFELALPAHHWVKKGFQK